MYNQQQQSYVPRGLINMLQIGGTIFAAMGILFTLLYLDQIYVTFSSNAILLSGLIAFELYILWKSAYSCFVIMNFMKHKTDEEIIANRWIIATMSLSVGGLMTPLVITMFGNVTTRSTINARWSLSKIFAIDLLVGGAILIGAFLGFSLVGAHSVALFSQITVDGFGIFMLIASFAMIAIGLIGMLFFLGNEQDFANKKGFGAVQNVLSYIFVIVATLQLVWLIIISVLRLIAAIMRVFRYLNQSDNFFMGLLLGIIAFLNLALTFIYIRMVIMLAINSIKGIWSRDEEVVIKSFEPLNEYNAQNANTQNKSF